MPWLFTLGCFAVVLLAGPRARAGWHRWRRPAWLVAALLSAVIGLLQYFGATAAAELTVNSTGVGEAYGNLRQRNQVTTLTNIRAGGAVEVVGGTGQGRVRLERRTAYLAWRALITRKTESGSCQARSCLYNDLLL